MEVNCIKGGSRTVLPVEVVHSLVFLVSKFDKMN